MGVLEPSRTIGDIDVKRMCPGAISAEPEVGIIDLLELASKEEAAIAMSNILGDAMGMYLGMFAILATDGGEREAKRRVGEVVLGSITC